VAGTWTGWTYQARVR